MKKLTIITLFFAVTSCVTVQIPKSMQEQVNRIENGQIANTKAINQLEKTQIDNKNEVVNKLSKLDEKQDKIIMGITTPIIDIDYTKLPKPVRDSIKRARGID